MLFLYLVFISVHHFICTSEICLRCYIDSGYTDWGKYAQGLFLLHGQFWMWYCHVCHSSLINCQKTFGYLFFFLFYVCTQVASSFIILLWWNDNICLRINKIIRVKSCHAVESWHQSERCFSLVLSYSGTSWFFSIKWITHSQGSSLYESWVNYHYQTQKLNEIISPLAKLTCFSWLQY